MVPVSDGVVTLSWFVPADAPVMMSGDADPEHRRRFEFPDDFVPSLQHALDVIARWERERLAGTRLPFAVRDAAAGTLLGGCEIKPLAAGAGNLSYWTYPEHRGGGVATRAVALARRLAFDDLGLERLEIVVDPDHAISRRIAERNGFQPAGTREGRLLYVSERAAGPGHRNG